MSFFQSLLGQAGPPPVPCAEVGLTGCGPATNALAENVLPDVALFLLRIAGGLSLIFMLVAGVQLMLAMGDESKISQQKKAVLNVMLGLSLAILSQGFVSAVATYNYDIADMNDAIVGGLFRYIIDIILMFVNIIFVCIVIVLGMRMVMAQGKTDQFNGARKGIQWVVSGAILINISHTMVKIVLTQFGV